MNLEHLNASQQEAVTTTEGPLIIIACAGSGKTTVLINRVAYMIGEKHVTPESILLLTFTNAAAQNMIEKANNLLDERCKRINASTYHSFCAKMLREFGKAINIDTSFITLTTTDVVEAINFIKANNSIYKEKGFPKSSTVADIFSMAVNRNMPISDVLCTEKYNKYAMFDWHLKKLWAEYTEYKKAKNFCDFDDLLTHFNNLLDIEPVRKKISERYKYVMVDEYQDTNNLQEQIIIKMCGNNGNLAIVGDDYQSIYKFRGSNVDNFLQFPKKLNNCKSVTLNTNYRSTKEILDFANAVMHNHASFGFPKTMVPNNKTGEKPKLVETKSQIAEAEFIYDKINRMKRSGTSLSEIAIIERNSYSSVNLEILLQQNGIAFKKLGGLKFLEHACVQDMLAYLRCMTNPLDELGWFRLLKLHPGIGDKYARNIAMLCSADRNFLENNSYKKRVFYNELLLLKEEVETNKNLDFHKAFDNFLDFYQNLRQRVIDEMDTDDDKRATYQEEFESEKETLKVLKDLSLSYSTALKLLDDLTLDNNKLVNGDNGVLTITTIHSAKGLEWDHVFILDCIDEFIPNEKAFFDSEEMNEELRCFYVAITRAKKSLYLMNPQTAIRFGKFMIGVKSCFLDNCENHYESVSYY